MRPSRPALRTRVARRLATAALLASALGACSDATGPRAPLEGRWLATGLPGATPTSATVELTLRQAGDDVSGTGSMSYPLGFASVVAVRGSVSGSVVTLTLESPALPQPMTMQAILLDGARRFTGQLAYGLASESRTFERTR